jgi:hypothetical protein
MNSNKRNGYTEIFASGSSHDGSKQNCRHFYSRSNIITAVVILLTSLLGIFLTTKLLTLQSQRHHRNYQKNEQTILIANDTIINTVFYRPECQIHSQQYQQSIQLIQTAMAQPSQQWSLQPCISQTTTGRIPVDDNTVTLNDYAAPDARILVNFSHVAFDTSTKILGFGGAFTQSAALNYNHLSATAKSAVMELLFGQDGLGYTLGRVHMNSCDFSTRSYSYDDHADDFELRYFDSSLQADVNSGIIDMARTATLFVRDAWASDDGLDGHLKLLASPWSPPAWMKKATWRDAPDARHAAGMTGSALPNCLREGVGPHSRYARAWAHYFSKYAAAYETLGVPLWAVTVQNEPEFPAPWEACAYDAASEREFVQHHLGPTLTRDHPDVKLFIFDHNKDHVNDWVDAIMGSESEAAQYVDGTAYHWYAGGTLFVGMRMILLWILRCSV